MNNKQASFPLVPSGEAIVETPDGTNKTMGSEVRNSLYDADYISHDCGYGAFSPDYRDAGAVPMPYTPRPRQGLRHLKERGEL